MSYIRKVLVAGLCLVVAGPSAAREGAQAPRSPAQKKESGVVAQPIKPIEKGDEKPRASWNGFYGGLNAGGGVGDTKAR